MREARSRAVAVGWVQVRDSRYIKCPECSRFVKRHPTRFGVEIHFRVPMPMYWKIQDIKTSAKQPTTASTVRLILADYFDDDFPGAY